MSQKNLFKGFSDEKQKQYEKEIRRRYGDRAFEGVKDWKSYTLEQQTQIKAESEAIYRDLLNHMDEPSDSPEVQKIIARWHQRLRYFYEPSPERMAGLAELYTEHPDFLATFKEMHPDLPKFLHDAIVFYVKSLKSKG